MAYGLHKKRVFTGNIKRRGAHKLLFLNLSRALTIC